MKSENWKDLMHCRVKKSKKVFINPLMMLIKEMPGIVIFLRLWFVTETIFVSLLCVIHSTLSAYL